jgi:uncharacterized protein (TIGR04255 family)
MGGEVYRLGLPSGKLGSPACLTTSGHRYQFRLHFWLQDLAIDQAESREGVHMQQREVYSNAPLRLVSLEIKFPITSRILTRSLWDSLEQMVGDKLPDVDIAQEEPDSALPHMQHEPVLRRISADQKRAVTLYVGALTIEIADYRCYEDLKALVESTISGLHDAPSILQPTRVGLRYINEVRWSDLEHEDDDKWQLRDSWAPYINADLLVDVKNSPEDLCAYAHRGTYLFHARKNPEQAVLDYGIYPRGVVDPDDVLVLGDPSGPCFIVDIDAYQYNSPKAPTILGAEELLHTLDRLHEVVIRLFDWSITDRMREVFRAPAKQSDESLLPASNG